MFNQIFRKIPRDKGARVRPSHPAKVNRKDPMRGLLRGVILAALMAGPMSLLATDSIALPGVARALDLHPEARVVAASMMLQGVAFVPVADDGTLGTPLVKPQWPTLDALPLRGDRFLLADRFGWLRLVGVEVAAEGTCTAEEIAQWKVEGTPTGLAMERELLLVASASAGVMAYHWDGTSTPRLVSRYPFVDYSKEIVIWHNGTVLLADNYETGLQVLSYTDPLKPRQLNSFQSGFVDSVTITGNMLAITDRRRGARILAVGPDGKTTPILDVPPLPATDPRGPDLKKVVFGPDARLMICEGPAGAQLVRFPMRGGKVAPNTVFRFDESGVMDAVFLDPGSALLSLMPGGIRLIRLPG